MTPFRGLAARRLDDPRTQVERLASFVSRANWGEILPSAREALGGVIRSMFIGLWNHALR